jgi:spore coat protein U-like protein
LGDAITRVIEKLTSGFTMKRLSLALVAMTLSAPAFAATATTSFKVTVAVTTTCTIKSTDLSFGTYNTAAATAVDASSTLTVGCGKGAITTIDLDEGGFRGATSTPALPFRQMSDGSTTNRVQYQLFQDSARTTAWGAGTATYSYTGTGATSALSVYGQIPAGVAVPVGAYADSVTATINY